MHVHMEFAQPVEREWTCRTSSIEEDLAVALETINSRRPDGMPPLNPSIGWKQKGPIAKTSDQPGEDEEDADTAVPISRHVEKFKACGKRCLGLIHVRNTLVLVVSGCYTANTLLLWLQAHVVAAHCAVRFRYAWRVADVCIKVPLAPRSHACWQHSMLNDHHNDLSAQCTCGDPGYSMHVLRACLATCTSATDTTAAPCAPSAVAMAGYVSVCRRSSGAPAPSYVFPRVSLAAVGGCQAMCGAYGPCHRVRGRAVVDVSAVYLLVRFCRGLWSQSRSTCCVSGWCRPAAV